MDFRLPHHLPKAGGEPRPDRLPRQRRGTTPQMHGRYPDFDVLAARSEKNPAIPAAVSGGVSAIGVHIHLSPNEPL